MQLGEDPGQASGAAGKTKEHGNAQISHGSYGEIAAV